MASQYKKLRNFSMIRGSMSEISMVFSRFSRIPSVMHWSGGYDGTRRLRSVEVLDPDSSPYWQQQPNKLQIRRSNFAVTVIDDKILIMGGYDGHGVTNACEMYIDGQWVMKNPMKIKRSALDAVNLGHYKINYNDFA